MRQLTLLLLLAATAATTVAQPSPDAAISARGIIESTEAGFRFPDGTVQTTAGGASFQRTVIVSPVGENAIASGTALRSALASITDASTTRRYLLKIEPGIYDLGSNQLAMKSFVDVEGSGENSTLILTSRGGSIDEPEGAGIAAASSTELRELTIRNISSWPNIGTAVIAVNVRNFRMRNVTVRSENSDTMWGIHLVDSDLDAAHVTVFAGGGVNGNKPIAFDADGPGVISLANCSFTADATGGGTHAYGMILDDGSASTIIEANIDSSTILVTGAETYAVGISVQDGLVTVTNSTIKVEDAPQRLSVYTAPLIGARFHAHHSRLIAGNSWSNANIKAAQEGSGSSLRLSASLVDSQAVGGVQCLVSYHLTGTLTATCTKAP
jgi:hypothetical protein